ncbi:MAG: hypothetical protein JRJ87_23285 [Deltaproteobacteria bacterium]|nr:hypothetical protein [Deltaproteobacteria bacterium]
MHKIKKYIGVSLAAVLLASCGPTAQEGVSLRVRFATTQQAQSDPTGLPLGVHSFKVTAYSGDAQGLIVGETECIDLSAADQRVSVNLDLEPQDELVLVAEGYGSPGCSSTAEWMGMAVGVLVEEGKEIKVPIYVTRRDMNLNGTNASLSPGRAFATATILPKGRVLIAGGFKSEAGSSQLTATAEAWIYDLGTATCRRIKRMSESRALHQALVLSDGRVMLVGGAKELRLTYQPGSFFQLSPIGSVTTADLFDPDELTFTRIGPNQEVSRMIAAAEVLSGDRIVMLGGRTSELMTNDIVVGVKSGETSWDWTKLSSKLEIVRSQALAVASTEVIMVVGGNETGTQPVEFRGTASFAPLAVVLNMSTDLSVTGHSLVKIDDGQALVIGGLPGLAGVSPLDALVKISFNNTSATAAEHLLGRPRAYHSAARMQDGKVLLAGGLDGDLQTDNDLELVDPQLMNSEALSGLQLDNGSVGIATALLPDGSILLVGGLDFDQAGAPTPSDVVSLLSP